MTARINVIGAGLAGCEAAWQHTGNGINPEPTVLLRCIWQKHVRPLLSLSHMIDTAKTAEASLPHRKGEYT